MLKWRVYHELFIYDDESRSNLIFISAGKGSVLTSENSTVRKINSILTVCSTNMQGYCDVYKGPLLSRTSPKSICFTSDVIKVLNVHTER